ncbi:SDR family NAD(P)-dependent oxidoreductase [Celeribacter sp.]|uniref:SDR family NAD(P)-dependent oxidoreductase n=1 Tax=Celeribacter sp. TaxID=1890673 RepID=UPI003A9556C3
MDKIEGKTALITGAANGIGEACATAFREAGIHVRGLDRDFSSVEDPSLNEGGNSCHEIDITDEAAIAAHFEKYGPVDMVVNCAGIVAHGSLTECSTEEFQRTLEVNVTGSFLVTRAAVAAALSDGRSLSIVNIASVISSLATASNRLAYATSKAAVIGMTKSVAFDYVRDNIRCNAVCPGTIDTKSLRRRLSENSAQLGGEERAIELFNERQPIGRMGTPEEIAELVLFVASPRTGFMTGAIVTADGGFTL